MDVWLEIIREDGTLERQRVEGDRVTVGRSPAAGIPIPDARSLDPEHLMIAPRAEGCWVAVAAGATAPVLVAGEPFQHGMLGWGTEIEVGRLKLRITDQLPKEKKVGGERTISPPVLVALLVMVPLLAWLLLGDDGTGLDLRPTAQPPELFQVEATCPSQSGGTARHRADRDAELAIAKAERYPFASQDGVDAVQLFHRAEACYRAMGLTTEAAEMAREAARLTTRIEEDYRTHRLRLERSLQQGRLPDALLETQALLALLGPRDHAYVEWLRQLERQLRVHIETT